MQFDPNHHDKGQYIQMVSLTILKVIQQVIPNNEQDKSKYMRSRQPVRRRRQGDKQNRDGRKDKFACCLSSRVNAR